MRVALRLLGAASAVSVLALLACIGSARAQTPPVVAPAVPWDEAQLDWSAPLTFASGGSLADCGGQPCTVKYVVEANAPNGNGWGPLAIVTATTYRVRGLYDGVWQFRVRAFWGLTGYSPPGPVVSKTVVEPVTPEPVVTPPVSMTVK